MRGGGPGQNSNTENGGVAQVGRACAKDRMDKVRLANRAERIDGTQPRGRGRPRIRWSDCVKRDLSGAEEHVAGVRTDHVKWRQTVAKTVDNLTMC